MRLSNAFHFLGLLCVMVKMVHAGERWRQAWFWANVDQAQLRDKLLAESKVFRSDIFSLQSMLGVETGHLRTVIQKVERHVRECRQNVAEATTEANSLKDTIDVLTRENYKKANDQTAIEADEVTEMDKECQKMKATQAADATELEMKVGQIVTTKELETVEEMVNQRIENRTAEIREHLAFEAARMYSRLKKMTDKLKAQQKAWNEFMSGQAKTATEQTIARDEQALKAKQDTTFYLLIVVVVLAVIFAAVAIALFIFTRPKVVVVPNPHDSLGSDPKKAWHEDPTEQTG